MVLETLLLSLGTALAPAVPAASGTEPPPAAPSTRPNVVFILADDLGWAELGS